MCLDPATLATMASAASSAVSTFAQQQQAEAQMEYQQQVYERNQQQALQARRQKVYAENLRQMQERQAASQQIQKQNREGAEARATAQVSAGESGVSGRSVDALLADFYRQEANYRSAVRQNFDMAAQQSEARKEGYVTEQQGRVTNAMPAPVQEPSFLGAALRIGGTVAEGYQKQQERKTVNQYLRG